MIASGHPVIATDGLPAPQRYFAFLTIAMALTMAVLDSAIVNVALPTIAKDLAISPADAIWVVNAYQLAVTISLLPLSSLGDILGYRRVYWWGLAIFTAASLVCALSTSLPVLSIARLVQGFGGAGIMSVNIALVRFIYPHSQLGRAVGYAALVVAVSSAAGPSVAALILSIASWQWLFLVNVPLGILALFVAARTLPMNPLSGRRFDVVSAALTALAFGLLITGVDGIGHGGTWSLAFGEMAAAAVFAVLLVLRQNGVPAPLLPVDLLKRPVFALSMATSLCSFSAQMLAYVSLPFYLEDVLGRSESMTGFLLTPWPLGTALTAPIAGHLAERYSPGRLCAVGLLVLAAGLVLVALLPSEPSNLDIVWRLAICGLGFGLFQSPNNKMIISSAPRDRSGGASGLQSSARLLGQSLGAAFVAVIFGLVHRNQMQTALWIGVGLSLAAAIASSFRRLEDAPAGSKAPEAPAA